MNIPKAAASLIDQLATLEITETFSNSGLACLDLSAFKANVAHQLRANNITSAQSDTINTWVGYIGTALACPTR